MTGTQCKVFFFHLEQKVILKLNHYQINTVQLSVPSGFSWNQNVNPHTDQMQSIKSLCLSLQPLYTDYSGHVAFYYQCANPTIMVRQHDQGASIQ